MRVLRRRIVSRGDLPASDGGLYNPGAVWQGDKVLLLCRREVDYRFTTTVHPECLLVDPGSLSVERHWTLARGPGLQRRRVEDFRCLELDGTVLVVHTLAGRHRIKPVLSRVAGERLELVDELELPIPVGRVEKNWVLFVKDGALHCLYRLDPLTVFVRAGRSWRLVKEARNGWQDEHEGTLSSSTNLIPFHGGFLGFWHTILHRRYVQGAFLLGDDLRIRARTAVLLDGIDVRDGFKPGVLYVSSILEHDGRILAFYGEGDAHTGVAIFDAAELAGELDRSPFPDVDMVRRGGAGRRRAACPLCALAPAVLPQRRTRRRPVVAGG